MVHVRLLRGPSSLDSPSLFLCRIHSFHTSSSVSKFEQHILTQLSIANGTFLPANKSLDKPSSKVHVHMILKAWSFCMGERALSVSLLVSVNNGSESSLRSFRLIFCAPMGGRRERRKKRMPGTTGAGTDDVAPSPSTAAEEGSGKLVSKAA